MAEGKIPGVRNLSKKEARELLKLPWVVDEALSDPTYETRVLSDGRVLHVLRADGSVQFYPSREALEEMNRRCAETRREAAKGPINPMRTLLPPVADFLRDVEAHAKSLGPRLGIPDDVLDFTPASLDAVDKAQKKIPWAKRQVPDLVTPLTAYVGEVLRKGSGGRWTGSPRPGKTEPVVIGRDGRICQPFAVVFLPMVEPSRRIPLRTAVDIQLRVGTPWGSDQPRPPKDS
jgi:hypothetical protein